MPHKVLSTIRHRQWVDCPLSPKPFPLRRGVLRRHPADDHWRRQRQPRNAVEDRREQVPRHGHFRQLERHILRVPRHLGSDLDQLFSQRRQRPVSHWFRQSQPTQEVAQVVG